MTERRMMNSDETLARDLLQGVTFPVASWDKRFARQLSVLTISDKEAPQLWRLFIRYRRQIVSPQKERLLKIAEGLAAPDFRKLEKQRREQERIEAEKAKYQAAMTPTTQGTPTL